MPGERRQLLIPDRVDGAQHDVVAHIRKEPVQRLFRLVQPSFADLHTLGGEELSYRIVEEVWRVAKAHLPAQIAGPDAQLLQICGQIVISEETVVLAGKFVDDV